MTRSNFALALVVALAFPAGGAAVADPAARKAVVPDTILYGAAYYHE